MVPPKIKLRYCKQLEISEQYLAKINRGERLPSLPLACALASLARDLGHNEATIADWRPELLEHPAWPEIARLCRKKKIKDPPK